MSAQRKVVARTHPGPRSQVPIARNRLHICSDFGQHHLDNPTIHPGYGVQPLDLSRKRARLFLDLSVQLGHPGRIAQFALGAGE